MEFKALMLASLDGSATSYRSLLERLSSRLRAYYKGKLARVGRGATEAEDLVQEVLLAIHLKAIPTTPGNHLPPGCTPSPDTSSSTICAGRDRLRASLSMRVLRSWRRTTMRMPRALTTSKNFWDGCRKKCGAPFSA